MGKERIEHALLSYTSANFLRGLHQILNQNSTAIFVQPPNPLNYNSIQLTSTSSSPFNQRVIVVGRRAWLESYCVTVMASL